MSSVYISVISDISIFFFFSILKSKNDTKWLARSIGISVLHRGDVRHAQKKLRALPPLPPDEAQVEGGQLISHVWLVPHVETLLQAVLKVRWLIRSIFVSKRLRTYWLAEVRSNHDVWNSCHRQSEVKRKHLVPSSFNKTASKAGTVLISWTAAPSGLCHGQHAAKTSCFISPNMFIQNSWKHFSLQLVRVDVLRRR